MAGNAVHITYCGLGIGWVISQSILALSLLKYAGAAYLIYLGIASCRAGRTSLDTASTRPAGSDRGWFLQGLLNNVLNPKGTLFYLGVFTMVITPETSFAMALILVLCMKVVSSSFWVVFVYTLDRPAIRRTIERGQGTVNRVFGVLMVGLGIRVAAMEQ